MGAFCQDLGGVATDLRKQGATILMVSAASSTIAIELANFLEQPAQTMEDKYIRAIFARKFAPKFSRKTAIAIFARNFSPKFSRKTAIAIFAPKFLPKIFDGNTP